MRFPDVLPLNGVRIPKIIKADSHEEEITLG